MLHPEFLVPQNALRWLQPASEQFQAQFCLEPMTKRSSKLHVSAKHGEFEFLESTHHHAAEAFCIREFETLLAMRQIFASDTQIAPMHLGDFEDEQDRERDLFAHLHAILPN